ncbi:MAG: hypothetical protein KatS3mg016_1359 [Fimbriimonadales bacterium]|nr:MAG: hypothetical protein KatS3mg016_1319 [Fimbriimonadales bacterium]GIV05784.1 MAG: hypothetical protein KatS3mg016_1359 [Fimbriimonadales bacterium]
MNVQSELELWMIGVAIILGLIGVWWIGRRLIVVWRNYWDSVDEQRQRFEQLRQKIRQLPLDEARAQAKQALLSEWVLEAKPAVPLPPDLIHSLPTTVRQLAEEYAEIVLLDGSVLFPGRPEPTRWRPNCYRIGWVGEEQAAELVVCSGEDTLYELDWFGSSKELPEVSTYPSIYHWIAYDFALFSEEEP